MAYCKKCGSVIDDNAAVCESCGASQTETGVADNGGLGWGLLGCCVPVAGLVLFLVWKDTKPKTAKAAGIGALLSVGIGLLWYIFAFAIGIGSVMVNTSVAG